MSDPDIYRRLERLERWRDDLASVEAPIVQADSWTPVVTGSSTPGALSYNYQTGRYVRIGSQVTVWCDVFVNTVTAAPTGILSVSGLPFIAANIADFNPSTGIGQYLFTTIAAGTITVAIVIVPNTDEVLLVESYNNAGTTGVDASLISNSCLLRFTLTYLIDG